MEYDFRSITRRRGSGSYKWDAVPPFPVSGDGDDIIPMWVADMDFRVAPFIIEALRKRVDHGIFGYTSVPESFYRSTIGWFSKYHEWNIDREWMMYTSGVVPAISAVIKALTSPGDEVIVQTPVYNCFFSSIRNNGCVITENPLLYTPTGKTGEFTYTVDWEDLEKKCSSPKAKILLLCNPHNPAGRVWTREELSRMGEIASRSGVIVVSDEIHCELVMEGYSYSPFASVSEKSCGNCITLCSPSKSFNTAGLQIANIIAPKEEWREKIDRAININEVCDVNPFGVIALEAAYTPEGKDWLDQLCRVIGRNYSLLREEFRSSLEEFPVCILEGTYLAWIDCHVLMDKGISSEKIEEELLKEEKVWINAGKMYGDDSFIRINLACPESLCHEGIGRIVRGLRRLLSE